MTFLPLVAFVDADDRADDTDLPELDRDPRLPSWFDVLAPPPPITALVRLCMKPAIPVLPVEKLAAELSLVAFLLSSACFATKSISLTATGPDDEPDESEDIGVLNVTFDMRDTGATATILESPASLDLWPVEVDVVVWLSLLGVEELDNFELLVPVETLASPDATEPVAGDCEAANEAALSKSAIFLACELPFPNASDVISAKFFAEDWCPWKRLYSLKFDEFAELAVFPFVDLFVLPLLLLLFPLVLLLLLFCLTIVCKSLDCVWPAKSLCESLDPVVI